MAGGEGRGVRCDIEHSSMADTATGTVVKVHKVGEEENRVKDDREREVQLLPRGGRQRVVDLSKADPIKVKVEVILSHEIRSSLFFNFDSLCCYTIA